MAASADIFALEILKPLHMKKITKKEFKIAEKRMNTLLAIVTKKGGFDKLTKKESTELNKVTQLVHEYEELYFDIPLPQTLQGLNEIKMYEKKIKTEKFTKMNLTNK